MKHEEVVLNDSNGLLITANIETDVFTCIDIQQGAIVYHFHADEFHLDEEYILGFLGKITLTFHISKETADALYDLNEKY